MCGQQKLAAMGKINMGSVPGRHTERQRERGREEGRERGAERDREWHREVQTVAKGRCPLG